MSDERQPETPINAPRPPLAMIAAVSKNGVIGAGDSIPWHHPADFRFFRRMTVGHVLIMGRKTFLSLGKPLPGRTHFVLSRDRDLALEGCRVFDDLDAAIAAARKLDPCPMITGGAQIYAKAMAQATLLYLTHIDENANGDILFPPVDWGQWQEKEVTQQGVLRFVTYRRLEDG